MDTEVGPETTGPLQRLALRVSETLVVLVGALVLTVVFRVFVFQAFEIPSLSMAETLQVDDRVIVSKRSYTFGDVSIGDVIVFSTPESVSSPYDVLIKRVVGAGGDTVEGRNNAVFVNGVQLDEPYVSPDELVADFGPVVVGRDEVFVLGDNRDLSLDSRIFGSIHQDTIVGQAIVVFWPLGRIGGL